MALRCRFWMRERKQVGGLLVLFSLACQAFSAKGYDIADSHTVSFSNLYKMFHISIRRYINRTKRYAVGCHGSAYELVKADTTMSGFTPESRSAPSSNRGTLLTGSH